MAALIAAALIWVFWDGILSYLGDQHYQEHFVYLWCFVLIALTSTLRGPFRSRFTLSDRRDIAGLACVVTSALALGVALASGSSTITRISFVALLTGLAVLMVTSWTITRCLMHGALLQLCFGLPYSFFFPLTNKLSWGVANVIELPTQLGLASYDVQDNVVCFPHYSLTITGDCSGVGQLLTFSGIAALATLVSAPNAKRAVAVLLLALLLAWISNIARVAMFVFFIAIGWTDSIDDPWWHASLGFLVFLPFIGLLIATIIKTHRPLIQQKAVSPRPGRWHIAAAVAPLLLVKIISMSEPAPHPEPAYFSALSSPPGHQLTATAPSQDADRISYGTRWLLGARFARSDAEWFDLLHYNTRSRQQLCIHKVANCIADFDQDVRYEPAVEVDGRPWWRISIDGEQQGVSSHAYFAFEVAGRRRDDSFSTQLEAIYRRAVEGNWDVSLTRVVLPGSLPEQPTDYESEILAWLGQTIDKGRQTGQNPN